MPDRHGELADVRSIYRTGDRVVVELPHGFYVLTIHSAEVIAGELWLRGSWMGFGTSFPARCIIRRLAPGERFHWWQMWR
ncbi:MAG: hypothetical protein QOH49_608 [Acidobacteriota bacterium]|jgi:hypothetical protein|nr:hypothetical protein [Acidobacteriota bacterium]